jgi:polar amino acid transport system substrate-binding protein
MPPVPAAMKKAGVFRVAEECDYPPAGFMDASGKPVGIEIEMAKQIATWAFGSPDKLEVTCVTTAARIPTLLSGKVDMIIATLGINPERAKVIDYSVPYGWGGASLLVVKDNPAKTLADLKGQTVILQTGTTELTWFEKNHPEIKTLLLDSVSDGLQALKQGRGAAFAEDNILLAGIAAKNPDFREFEEVFDIGTEGIGVRKGEADTQAFANWAIAEMKANKLFAGWGKTWVEPSLLQANIDMFEKPVPQN